MSIPTVESIPFTREVITIPADTKVLEAFSTLVKNNILSAPVLETDGSCIGLFSVRDMASYIVESIQHRQDASPIELCDLSEFIAILEKTKPTSPLRDIAKKNPLRTVAPNAPLQEVLELLGQQGAHRVAVIDGGKILKIVSQSRVAKFLHEHAWAPLQAFRGKTVEETGLGTKPCLTVKSSTPAFEAFKIMNEHGLSGVGVVDEDGTLVTSISLTDLRTIVSQRFQFMGVSALEFVQRSRSMDGPREKPAVVTVTPQTTLLDVVGKLAASGLHRVFVIDGGRKPIGVISLKDVLRYILIASTD